MIYFILLWEREQVREVTNRRVKDHPSPSVHISAQTSSGYQPHLMGIQDHFSHTRGRTIKSNRHVVTLVKKIHY
jgi:hypothetical protein